LQRARATAAPARPLWLAIAVSVPVILLLYARLVVRRTGGKSPRFLDWVTMKDGGRRVKHLVERALATVGSARRRERVRQVELAALEVAEDDGPLSPDAVRTAAEALFRILDPWPPRGGLWRVLNVEERAQGKHHLADPIGAPTAAPQ